MNKHKVGMALGMICAFFGFVWSIVVALGLGQWMVDKKMHLLFLNNPFTILPFNFWKMVALVVGLYVGAYIMGWIFAYVWNWYNKKPA